MIPLFLAGIVTGSILTILILKLSILLIKEKEEKE